MGQHDGRRPQLRAVSVLALIVPADTRRRCELRELALTAAALSDALGGGLLDDTLRGTLRGTPCHHHGDGFTVYLDDDRAARALPANPRATTLAGRLGCLRATRSVPLLGDALVIGRDPHDQDVDVPTAVLATARALGLLGSG